MILYKYLDADGGLKSLDSETIWLARPNSFNDPFDVLPHIDSADHVKGNDDLKINTSDIVVLCLADRVDSPLMWAHYARSHSGLLIGFDRKGRIIEDGLIFRRFGAVSYSRYRPSRPSFDDLSDEELYFRKSSEWAYEREWRLVTSTIPGHATKVRETHWSFQMYAEDIVNVVVGHRGKSCFPGLYEILRRPQYKHVDLYFAIPHQEEFGLEIVEWQRDKWDNAKVPEPIAENTV